MKTFGIAIILLIVGGAIAGFVFWNGDSKNGGTALNHADAYGANTLDVVCSGRVSAAGPEIHLYSKVPGQVTAVRVNEGELVQAQSSTLFELDDTNYKIKLDGAQAGYEAARSAVNELEKERTRRLPLLKDMQSLSLEAARISTQEARNFLKTLKDQQAKDAKIDLTADIDRADSAVKKLEVYEKAELIRLKLQELEDLSSKIEQANANLRVAQAEVAAARQAVEDCKVKAPSNGTLLQIFANVGTQTAPGTQLPLAIIAPAGPLVVLAELDQEHLGKVVAGQMCTFKDETRSDSPTWEGQVTRVNGYVRKSRSLIFEPGEINDIRTVEVVIEPKIKSGKDILVIGQRVRVRFSKID
ncbi:MAG: HlyD family efflux transporter periplasmic adaptor subunit [Gemmataceae bacterium]